MTRAKRPKLGAVLRGEGATVPISAQSISAQAEQPLAPPVAPAEKMVQLNVTVPEELRRELRIRALQQGADVGVIVRQLLQDWLRDT
ncbi:hypothetical protein [Deinococcus sp.]|uniref:hypothetical protein n=1 Tax=Deinococcus sp. TaxID=47478 RepID=UPI003CC5303B